MCQATQARLNTANDDGHVLVDAADKVAVDRDSTVGASACYASWCVGIGVAAMFGHGVVIHHRVHIAGANKEPQPRLAKRLNALCIAPVRLTNNAHTVTMGF